jgi:hypothetical protein
LLDVDDNLRRYETEELMLDAAEGFHRLAAD